jgi:hypothetical protein
VNLADIARKAADIISERGLAKGKLQDEQGRVCNNGALLLAMGVQDLGTQLFVLPEFMGEFWNILQDAEKEVLRSQDIKVFYVSEYNDRKYVSAEDIILLLKKAGSVLEEAGGNADLQLPS